MDNYLCINGKKTELTEEQLKQLGIELPKKSCFERVNRGEPYYYINNYDKVDLIVENCDRFDDQFFLNANYCADKAIMERRALHETLNRLLWRYSMEHDGDKINWGKGLWFKVSYNHNKNDFVIECNDGYETLGAVYFYTRKAAEDAIEEVIKPFIVAHPEIKF